MDRKQWLKGIDYEVAYWNNVFRWKSTWFYNTVQFISQPLPVEWKNWLKSVYGKLRRGSMRLSVMSPVKRHGFLKS